MMTTTTMAGAGAEAAGEVEEEILSKVAAHGMAGYVGAFMAVRSAVTIRFHQRAHVRRIGRYPQLLHLPLLS